MSMREMWISHSARVVGIFQRSPNATGRTDPRGVRQAKLGAPQKDWLPKSRIIQRQPRVQELRSHAVGTMLKTG